MSKKDMNFSFEDAFKALSDIDLPVPKGGIRPNKVDIRETFNRKQKLDLLMEEYYDLSAAGELEQAKADRQAEVAQAKLARIEKIVDLDATSVDELQPSYVGKIIVQCPQCMTLFYKNPADIVESETDSTVVNEAETCQHCGNTSGYNLIGKVAAAEVQASDESEVLSSDAAVDDSGLTEVPVDDANEAVAVQSAGLDTTENETALDAEDSDQPMETSETEESEQPTEMSEAEEVEEEEETSDEDEPKNESFINNSQNTIGESLTEEAAKDLTALLDKHNQYIVYLQTLIKQDEKALASAQKLKAADEVISTIEKRLAATKEDLENALPEAVKAKTQTDSLPTPEETSVDEMLSVDKKTSKSIAEQAKRKEAVLAERKAKESNKPSTWQSITWELFGGKTVKNSKGHTYYDRGIYDSINNGWVAEEGDNNIAIVAPTKEELVKAIEVANKYGKQVIGPIEQKYAKPSQKYRVEIVLDDSDVYDGFNESIEKLEACHKKASKIKEATVSKSEFDQLMTSKEFTKPIDDREVQRLLNDSLEVDTFADVEEVDEDSLSNGLEESLRAVYKNINKLVVEKCSVTHDNKLLIEGVITLQSDKKRHITYTFVENLNNGKKQLVGSSNIDANKLLITYAINNATLMTESVICNRK